jgi:hypothetical protein
MREIDEYRSAEQFTRNTFTIFRNARQPWVSGRRAIAPSAY